MSILAKHTVGKGGPDKVFKISGMAKARAAEVGKENIVNATTGAFLDGNGRIGRLLAFKECLKNNIPPFIIEDTFKDFDVEVWRLDNG